MRTDQLVEERPVYDAHQRSRYDPNMPDPTSAQPCLDAAEEAAAAGDLAAAEEHLRRAVQSQETHLGPQHPDLANALNNLGVLCEKTGQLDEAERCYRRAHAIATAAFDPDHPFAITSRKNLADFLEAQGRPLDPPAATAPASGSPAITVSPPTIAPATGDDDARRGPRQSRFGNATGRLLWIAVVVVIAVVVAIVMSSPSRPPVSSSPPSSPVERTPIAPAAERDAAANRAAPVVTEPVGAPKDAAPLSTAPAGRSLPEASARRRPAQPTVAEAQVCRGFSTDGSPDWRCDQVGASVAPGSLVYYTRIKAASATTLEHRWYHGDDLQQSVRLRVAANPGAGYRTYSRLAVSAAGAWRVELRTTDGTLLDERRFDVR